MGARYPEPQTWGKTLQVAAMPPHLAQVLPPPSPTGSGSLPGPRGRPCLLLWGVRRLKLCSSSWWVRVGLAPAIRRTVASWRKTWKGRQDGG